MQLEQFKPAIVIFSLIGMIQVFIWFKKRFSIIQSLVMTVVALILSFCIVPLGITVFGVFVAIRYIFKFIIKRTRKNKRTDIPEIIPAKARNEENLYLESNEGTIEIGNIYRGIIVQGGAGSGKSKSLFYPIIEQLMRNEFAGVIYDFKSPELSSLAHYYHKSDGKTKFAFLNFKDFKISDRVNPLSPRYITKQAVAFEMATVLVNNLLPESIKKKDYWSRSSISVIAGAIWFLRNNYPQYCSIPHLTSLILDLPSSKLIEIISNDLETAGMISSLKEAYEMKAEKQIAGVIGTIKNSIAILNIPEVFYLMSSDDVNLEINDPIFPTFLAIGNDSTLADTYAPMISCVISVCLRQMNQQGRHKSAVLLDEAPTLYIPNFEQIPATARSNKIATVFGLQDYSQMIDKYGHDKAQVMISNLGNQFYGRTVNERTAKMITNLFGKEDQIFRSVSTGESSAGGLLMDSQLSKSTSTSESMQERDRVKISDVTNASPGVFYGVIAQGNKKELLGVRLNEVEENHKPFEQKNDVDTKMIFQKIHNDIKEITRTPEIDTDENSGYKIEL